MRFESSTAQACPAEWSPVGWKLSSRLNSQTRRVVTAKNQPQNLQAQHDENVNSLAGNSSLASAILSPAGATEKTRGSKRSCKTNNTADN